MTMTKQQAFYFDASACNGCKACQIACKDKNSLPLGVNWRRVAQYGGGNWLPHPTRPDLVVANNITAYSMSVACMHCQNPVCVQACPTQALAKREDGVVLLNQDACIGCRYCECACPYGAPQYNEAIGKMTKCNFCEDLLAKGVNPACVDSCPARALEAGDLDQLRAKYGTLNAIEPLPQASLTNPSLVITPHRHSQMSGKGTGRILNREEL
jgi:anaerobic dimethyl sulfoxide reductase subunit B (iron-sulfur subunit)